MSSVYHDSYGSYEASRAVDGNKDPAALKVDNSCSITGWEASPWWAVDLGAALSVLGVLFTNRAEYCGNIFIFIFQHMCDFEITQRLAHSG